jgi:polyhydroxybutyrate depolymerase
MVRARAVLPGLLLACCIAACGSSLAQAKRPASSKRSTPAKKGQATGGLKTINLTSGGHQRTYLLYAPPGDSKRHPLPLVLVYHGALDTASHTTTETNLLSTAQRSHNMILVFPQGYQDTWNEGAGHTPAEQAHINDVAFTAAILSRVESNFYVNPHLVVATGLSNGALLTELLGCRLAGQLTLIAPVEGQLPASVSPGCHPSAPIGVYEIHGTADQAIPYGGGHFNGVGGGTTVLSAPASAARWASLDRCARQPQTAASGGVTLSLYNGCRDGVHVTLDTIEGGQHQWPTDLAQTLLGAMYPVVNARSAAP